MDKQELLNTIQREADVWEAFLDEVGEERMEQPGATGDWSFKDVVAHISTWRARTLERLEAAARDETPSRFWPTDWDEDDDEDLEKINRWIYEKNQDRPLPDVLNESRQQFRRMEEMVRVLPESKLFDTQYFEWMEGRPLADVIGASFGHFHEEHEPVLRRWLSPRSTP